jgi:hypothetical protein
MPSIPPRVQEVAAQLAAAKPMRRGSVSTRYVRCNKPGCPCTERAEARHGPYISLVRVVAGRTQSRWVSASQEATLRRQVEAGHQFRKQVEALWEVCEHWADAELEATVSQETAKKGASGKPSKQRLRPRSRRS